MKSKNEKIVYFAAAIRGDRVIAEETIENIVSYIKNLGFTVLNEHVGAKDPIASFGDKIGKRKESLTAEDIEKQDISWLDKSTHVIAEISGASTGTGREIEYARTKGFFNKIPAKILCVYRKDREFYASPMIRGMTQDKYPNVKICSYENTKDLEKIINGFLEV